MSDEESKQPRKVKDLKARLGRTIAPNTPGAPPIAGIPGAVPPGAAAGAVIPPPAASGGPAIPPPGVAPVAPGSAMPAIQLPGKQVVAPPFVKAEEERRKRASEDPFAAAHPSGPQKVTLVIDDSKVADHEVGRAGRNRALYGIVAGASLLAIIVGYGLGSVMKDRRWHNDGIDASKRIYASVHAADDELTKVRQSLDQALTSARGAPGRAPKADYAALQAMLAVENPFRADAFSRQRYDLFNAAAVDALFSYYQKVNRLFDQIRTVTARNLSQRRRAELDDAAQNAAAMVTDQTGCVPVIAEQRIFCNLVYVDPPAAGAAPSPNLRVRQTKTGSAAQEREIYTGQNIVQNPDKFVILTNTQTSVGVLGQRASAFGEYSRDLAELKRLVDEIDETKGRFEQELDRIRSTPEVVAF